MEAENALSFNSLTESLTAHFNEIQDEATNFSGKTSGNSQRLRAQLINLKANQEEVVKIY